jgi:uncharacterized BrkB/YihY/UPF0761 family membrane protein
VMLPVLFDHNLNAFWHDTIAYQASRAAPFSIWGLWGGVSIAQHLVQGAAVALAVLVAFLPGGRRTVLQTAALGAAVIIAVQLGLTYWFYLYIVWFFPLVALAAFGSYPAIVDASSDARGHQDLLDRDGAHRLGSGPDQNAVQPGVVV